MVDEENAPFYEVHSLACHACYMKDLYARDAAESNDGKSPLGRYYAVTPKG
jgi:hypothetical protein